MCIENKRERRWLVDPKNGHGRIRNRGTNNAGGSNIIGDSAVYASSRHLDVKFLRGWESTPSLYRTSSVFITTFNVNGCIPTLDGIPSWLNCEGILPPDFYIIGLQEMDFSPQAFIMNASTRHMEWKVIIAKSFPKGTDYDLVSEIRLVGILLAVYRRIGSKIKVHPSEIDAVMVPTGRYNVFGRALSDKGAVAISMCMNDTAVCFVNVHFAAHIGGNEKRILDYKHIVKNIRFNKNGKTLFEHDAVFWFGDLNFRLDTAYGMNNNELRKLCNDDEAFRDMLLKRAMKLKIIFKNFKEPEFLNFRPTFKYDINSDKWDSSRKKRVPAWCDRILWWNQKGVHIRQKFYDSVPSIRFSDHRPVRALFYLGVREIDPTEYEKTYRRVFKGGSRRRNDYRYKKEETKE
ncbi:Uncharacterized protein BM_BM14491 [Brugia malayi]|uniref:IPPc domain-containing protein n=1 Tax=Brugia malayi TaxID=6279 RepID=A0A4E9FLA8_BRUMA|nr:Uncharacterized protein BM_BM14491 [Brugia malayi]VIO96278.1 Uncharacterized protein BM_BM14491 [Brugia malayi]